MLRRPPESPQSRSSAASDVYKRQEDKFEGVIDLIEMKADLYDEDELGTKWDTVDVPDDYKEAAQKAHNDLIEAVADVDDGIMDKYLEGEEISNAELKAAIRKATINLEFYPVLAGSAFKNKGCLLYTSPSPRD